MLLCSNCDSDTSRFRCVECDSPFCEECSRIHVKVKNFRTHAIEPLAEDHCVNRKCCNCEEQDSKFYCKDCGDDDKYLCVGCSVLHPKIKSFRGHNVAALNRSSFTKRDSPNLTLSRLQQLFLEHIESIYTVLIEGSLGEMRFWRACLSMIVMALVYFLVTKALLGSAAMIWNVGVAISFYYRSIFRSSNAVEPSPKHREQNPGSDAANSIDDFSNEFPYPLKGRNATFRPRSKFYKGRGAGKKACMSVVESESYDLNAVD
jgi:hypothetical protein